MKGYVKTRIKITGNSPYGDYRVGDTGVIDGYCRGGDDTPYAVVIIGKRFVLVALTALEFDEFDNWL